jgi:hypothetical protein
MSDVLVDSVRICMYACMHACMLVHPCMYACMYVYMPADRRSSERTMSSSICVLFFLFFLIFRFFLFLHLQTGGRLDVRCPRRSVFASRELSGCAICQSVSARRGRKDSAEVMPSGLSPAGHIYGSMTTHTLQHEDVRCSSRPHILVAEGFIH